MVKESDNLWSFLASISWS